ncbi:MAG: SMC-Scp complex subunit ScpB [Pirellulales bacterium]|nr:SMC-Scp complex subunit ScpB [Pirellulales bacterium]
MEMSFRQHCRHLRSAPLGGVLQSSALRYRFPKLVVRGRPQQVAQPLRGVRSRSHQESVDTAEAGLARLEAVLFLAREPLSTRKLANLAKLADGTEARTLLKELAKRLRQRSSALQVVDVAGGVQLLTRTQLADWLRRLHGGPKELRLSGPAIETLSVVAYRQPIVRAEIEAIRGVQCGEILRVLMERDLLRIVGRADELGRPFLYGTTKNFLQVFGLRRLEELPLIDQIHTLVS